MMNVTGPIGANQVRIDGTYIPAPNKPTDEGAPGAAGPKGSGPGEGARSAEVVLSQERLIAEAAASEEVNVKAVEEARTLLDSGELDTPEAALRAAQAILDLGL